MKVNDIITNGEGHRALVLALNGDRVQALLFDQAEIYAGDRFFVRDRGLQFSFGEHLFGRVINSLGEPIDDRGGFPRGNTHLNWN